MTIYRVQTFRYGAQNFQKSGDRGGNTIRDFDDLESAQRYAKDQVEVGGADTASVKRIEARS